MYIENIEEELKEENKVLRQALSDIAANLGNGFRVSVDASLPFIKELPHQVKLVCDGLRKELAREKKTCNNLRRNTKKYEKLYSISNTKNG